MLTAYMLTLVCILPNLSQLVKIYFQIIWDC